MDGETSVDSTFSIDWKETPLKDRPKNYGWSEDGKVDGKIYYRMYFNNDDSKVYLYDLNEDQYYILPDGAKYRGYLIAFKLYKLRKNPTTPTKTVSSFDM